MKRGLNDNPPQIQERKLLFLGINCGGFGSRPQCLSVLAFEKLEEIAKCTKK